MMCLSLTFMFCFPYPCFNRNYPFSTHSLLPLLPPRMPTGFSELRETAWHPPSLESVSCHQIPWEVPCQVGLGAGEWPLPSLSPGRLGVGPGAALAWPLFPQLGWRWWPRWHLAGGGWEGEIGNCPRAQCRDRPSLECGSCPD